MLKITEIKKEAMPVSNWSGGTTTEICIWPEGAKYAEREFLFRISTAKVELEESDFTSLPDYMRLIAALDGGMLLTHGNDETAEILPLSTVHRFDGGIPTHCVGKARDLNLMLRKGKADGELRFIEKGGFAALPMPAGQFALVYDIETGDAKLARADEDDFLAFSAEHDCALFTVREI